jgi:hypothetical protein
LARRPEPTRAAFAAIGVQEGSSLSKTLNINWLVGLPRVDGT